MGFLALRLIFTFIGFIIFVSVQEFVVLIILLTNTSVIFTGGDGNGREVASRREGFTQRIIIVVSGLPSVDIMSHYRIR